MISAPSGPISTNYSVMRTGLPGLRLRLHSNLRFEKDLQFEPTNCPTIVFRTVCLLILPVPSPDEIPLSDGSLSQSETAHAVPMFDRWQSSGKRLKNAAIDAMSIYTIILQNFASVGH